MAGKHWMIFLIAAVIVWGMSHVATKSIEAWQTINASCLEDPTDED